MDASKDYLSTFHGFKFGESDFLQTMHIFIHTFYIFIFLN